MKRGWLLATRVSGVSQYVIWTHRVRPLPFFTAAISHLPPIARHVDTFHFHFWNVVNLAIIIINYYSKRIINTACACEQHSSGVICVQKMWIGFFFIDFFNSGTGESVSSCCWRKIKCAVSLVSYNFNLFHLWSVFFLYTVYKLAINFL